MIDRINKIGISGAFEKRYVLVVIVLLVTPDLKDTMVDGGTTKWDGKIERIILLFQVLHNMRHQAK